MRKKRVMLAALCVGSMFSLYGCSLIDEQWKIVENYRLENTTTEEKKQEVASTEEYKKQDVLEDFLHTEAMTLAERIDTPNGYKRVGETEAKKKDKTSKEETVTEDISLQDTVTDPQNTSNPAIATTQQAYDVARMISTSENADTQEEASLGTSEAASTTQDIISKRDNTSGKTYTIEEFMHNIEVKSADEKVLLYNGEEKENQDSYAAILNLQLDKGNLQQKASSIMRLYAEYSWTNRDYDNMKYHLINGFEMDYATWITGKRVKPEGNSSVWYEAEEASDTYSTLLSYLEYYFCYSDMSAMLSDSVEVTDDKISVGDYFTDDNQENAAFVIDVAEDAKGNRCFLLAAGGSPGQDIEILRNPAHEDPWYYENEVSGIFETPEFTLNGVVRRRLITSDSHSSSEASKNKNEKTASTQYPVSTDTKRTTTQSAASGTTKSKSSESTVRVPSSQNTTDSTNTTTRGVTATTSGRVPTTQGAATTQKTEASQSSVTTQSNITNKSMASESQLDNSTTQSAGTSSMTTQSAVATTTGR